MSVDLATLIKKKDVDGLLAVATSGPGAHRARAAEALAGLGKSGEKAADGAVGSSDVAERVVGATLVGLLGGKSAEKTLLGLLKDDDARVRRAAVIGLGTLDGKPSAAVKKALAGALEDDSSAVRGAAARILAREIGGSGEPLTRLSRSRYGTVRAAALAALTTGEAAVEPEQLDRPLSDDNRAIRREAARLAGVQSPPPDRLLRSLSDSCPLVRREAADGLPLTEASEPALAGLLQTEPDPETRRAAVRTLGSRLDDATRAVLARALEDLDPEVRDEASRVLEERSEDQDAILARHWVEQEQWERCVEAGETAVPALLDTATRVVNTARELRNRVNAIAALGRIGDKRAVDPLAGQLDDADGRVRAASLEALGVIGESSALEAALQCLGDLDPETRAAALGCAAALGDAGTAADIEPGLDDPEPVVREAAVRALGRLGALDRLAKLVRAPEHDVRIEALGFLGDIGRPDAIAPVLRGLTDSNALVRQAAEAALRQLNWLPVGLPTGPLGGGYSRWLDRNEFTTDKDTRPALEVLREAAAHESALMRRAAIEALAREHDHDGLKAIQKRLTDDDPDVRMTAAVACAALGDTPGKTEAWAAYHVYRGSWDEAAALGKVAVGPLARGLAAKRAADRRAAASALGSTGQATAEAPLEEALADAEAVVRRAAVLALGELKATDRIPAIIQRLDDPDERVRTVAIDVLVDMGKPAAEPALDALTRAEGPGRAGAATVLGRLKHAPAHDTLCERVIWDPAPPARAASARALGALGNKKANDALVGALGDAFADVRDAARDALTACGWKADAAVFEAAEHLAVEHWTKVEAVGPAGSPLLIGCLSDTARDPRTNRRRAHAARLLGVFEAKQARELLERCLRDAVQEVRWESAGALGRIADSKSTVALRDGLEHPDVETTRQSALALASVPGKAADDALLEALDNRYGPTRAVAAEALGARTVAGAAPNLITHLVDAFDPAARAAFGAIRALGAKAIDALAERTTGERTRLRRLVATLLRAETGGAPALVGMLADDDAQVRVQAARGLGEQAHKPALDALAILLRDPDGDVRAAAVEAGLALQMDRAALIGALADPAPAVTALVQRGISPTADELTNAEAATRGDIAALEAAGDAGLSMVAHVLATHRADAAFKAPLCAALRGSDAPGALDALARSVEADDDDLQVAAAQAQAHPVAAPNWDRIDAVMRAAQGAVRGATLAALAGIDPKRAGQPLLEAARNEDPRIRLQAVTGLAHVPGQPAVDALLVALNDRRSEVASAAITALATRQAHATLPAILDKVDATGSVARAAVEAAGALADGAFDTVVASLRTGTRAVRRLCAELLSGDKKAGDALTDALADPDPPVRWRAADGLGAIGSKPAASEATAAALTDACWDPDPQVRAAAVGALASRGITSEAVVGALADLDASVRIRANRAAAVLDLAPTPEFRAAARELSEALSFDAALDLRAEGVPLIGHAMRTYPGLVDARVRAITVLSSIPADSPVDVLVVGLRADSHAVRAAAADGLGKHPRAILARDALIDACQDTDPTIGALALGALARTDGQTALPLLEMGLRSPDYRIRRAAAAAMGEVPDAPAAGLVSSLSDPDKEVRRAAAASLGQLRRGSEATAELLERFADPDQSVREAAVASLGALVGDARDELTRALATGAPETRRAAVRALSGDPEAADKLIASLDDGDAAVRHGAAIALGRLEITRAIDPLLPLLHDDDAQVRAQAAVALGRLGGPKAPLLGAMADQDTGVWIAASGALFGIGAAASDAERDAARAVRDRMAFRAQVLGDAALPFLAHALWTDTSGGLVYRQELAKALSDKDDSLAVDALAGATRDRDPELRVLACTGLGHPAAASALTALIDRTRDPLPVVREAALLAIAKADPDGGEATLLAGLDDPYPQVRTVAATALGLSGSERALIPLSERVASDDQALACAAAEALGAMGPNALEPLREHLKADRVAVRLATIRGLALQPAAAADLVHCLADPEEQVRAAAAESLRQPDDAAIAVLAELSATDPDGLVRAACLRAIDRGKPSKKTGQPLADMAVSAAFGDRHPEVLRAAAEIAAANHPMRPAPQWLRLHHWDPLVAHGEAALPVLLRVLRDDRRGLEDGVRRAGAAQALVRIGGGDVRAALRDMLDDVDEVVRKACYLGLAGLDDQDSATGLAMRFGRSDGDERRALAQSLAMLGAESALEAAAQDGDPDVRLAAARGLVTAKTLLGLVDDADSRVRMAAGERIAELAETGGTDATIEAAYALESDVARDAMIAGLVRAPAHAETWVLRAVDDPAAAVRRRALEVAAHLNLAALAPAASAALGADPADAVRLQAARTLGVVVDRSAKGKKAASTTTAALESLVLALADQTPSVVVEARKSLERLDHTPTDDERAIAETIFSERWRELSAHGPGILPFCQRILAERTMDRFSQARRVGVCQALGDLGDAKALDFLVESTADAATRVRAASAFALGRIGDAKAIDALAALAADSDPSVRVGVCQGLRMLGGEKAVEVLYGLKDDPERDVRIAAAIALAGPKTFALDKLIELLLDRDPAVRIKAAHVIAEMGDVRGTQPLIDALGDANAEVRYHVRAALGDLGWAPVGYKHAADDRGYAFWTSHADWSGRGDDERTMLEAGLTDDDAVVRRTAAEGLAELGDPASAEALGRLLDDPEPDVRRVAARALDTLGSAPPDIKGLAAQLVESGRMLDAVHQCGTAAVAPLLRSLKEGRDSDRRDAAAALGRVDGGADDANIRAGLEQATSDAVDAVRWRAVEAAGALGAEALASTVAERLDDDEQQVRDAAAAALGAMPGNGRKALAAGLEHASDRARLAAAGALAGLEAGAAFAAKALIACLGSDANADVRALAAGALSHVNTAAAGKALLNALEHDTDERVRCAAIAGMALSEPTGARDALIAALSDEYASVRDAAIGALDALGWTPDGPELTAALFIARESWKDVVACGRAALPLLVRVAAELGQDKPSVVRRAGAVGALGAFDGEADASRAVVAALADPAGPVRTEACRAAGRLAITDAGETLAELLDDPIDSVRQQAAVALGQVGYQAAGPALELMAENDRHEGARKAAAEALATLGVAKVLIRRLTDPDPEVRRSAADALGGLDDPEAIDPLILTLGDSVATVRSAASGALEALGWIPIGARLTAADVGYSRWVPRSTLLARYGDDANASAIIAGELDSDSAAARRCALEAVARARGLEHTDRALALLDDDDRHVRREAADTLQLLGRLPREGRDGALAFVALGLMRRAAELGEVAEAPLIRAVLEHAAAERRAAADALSAFASPAVADALARALRDDDSQVRLAAATTLQRVDGAVDALCDALADTNTAVRHAAGQALATRGKAGEAALSQALDDDRAPVRAAAADGLATFGPTRHLAALTACLESDEAPTVRCAAARALGRAGADGVAPLEEALQTDTHETVRAAAAAALGDIAEGGGLKSNDALITALGDRYDAVRSASLDALKRSGWSPDGDMADALLALAREDWRTMGQLGDVSAPLLVRVASERGVDKPSVARREGALEALTRIGGDRAVQAFSDALADDAGPVLAAALRGISQHAETVSAHAVDATVRPRIRALLADDPRPRVRVGAASAIALLGDAEAARVLERAAQEDDDRHVRLAAASALANPRIKATGLLAERLLDPSPAVRESAAQTLGRSEALDAIDPLIGALGDAVAAVRRAARDALVALGFAPVGLRHTTDASGYVRWIPRAELVSRSSARADADQQSMLIAVLADADAIWRLAAVEGLTQHLPSADESASDAAEGAQNATGHDTIAAAIRPLLDDPDEVVRRTVAAALQRVGVTPDGDEAPLVAVATGHFDEAAALGDTAVPALVRALNEHAAPSDRAAAATALGTVGGETAGASLAAALGDDDALVRRAAVDAIGSLGSALAAPAVQPLLSDFDAEVRTAAARALTQLGDGGAKVLASALGAATTEARAAAAFGLGLLGDAARHAEPALADHLANDAEVEVRQAAATALSHMRGTASDAALLTATTDDPAPEVRRECARALGFRGPRGAAEVLVAALADSFGDVRAAATAALYALDAAPDGPTGDALLALAADDWDTLVTLGDAATPLLGRLATDSGDDPDSLQRRCLAVQTLRRIGTTAALAHIQTALGDVSARVRKEAARAAADGDDAMGAALLERLQNDAFDEVRIAAAISLGVLGYSAAASTLSELAENDRNPTVRLAAATALAAPGISRTEPLVALLSSPDPSVRAGAAESLGPTGDTAAIDPLIGTLGDAFAAVRLAAREALEQLGWTPIGLKSELTVAGYSRWITRGESLGNDPEADQNALLLADLEHGDAARRFAALEGLALRETRGAIGAATRLLDDPDQHVRARAATTIQTLGGLPASANDATRAAYAVGLGRLGAASAYGPAAHAALVRALTEHGAAQRVAACSALVSADPSDTVLEALATALDDSDAAVRVAACQALGQVLAAYQPEEPRPEAPRAEESDDDAPPSADEVAGAEVAGAEVAGAEVAGAEVAEADRSDEPQPEAAESQKKPTSKKAKAKAEPDDDKTDEAPPKAAKKAASKTAASKKPGSKKPAAKKPAAKKAAAKKPAANKPAAKASGKKSKASPDADDEGNS